MMTNFTYLRPIKALAIATLLAISCPLFAQNAVYRWTGEDGVTHYGAMPPLGVEAELVKAGSSNSGNAAEEAATTTSSNVGGGTQASQEEAAPKVELSPEMKARKETLCKDERQRLSSLQKPGRIRMQQPDGSTKYLSVEEVQAEINTTQQVIKDTCN